MWICDHCDVENKDSNISCRACGHQNDTERGQTGSATKLILQLIRSTFDEQTDILPRGSIISISSPGGDIGFGRSDIAPEVFNNNIRLSAPHCSLMYKEGIWKTLDYNSTNGTEVNGENVPSGIDCILPLPCKLRIANYLFMAKEEAAEQSVEDCPPVVEEIWVIECPNTRTRYPVIGPNERMSECQCCTGMMRRRIANRRPFKL